MRIKIGMTRHCPWPRNGLDFVGYSRDEHDMAGGLTGASSRTLRLPRLNYPNLD